MQKEYLGCEGQSVTLGEAGVEIVVLEAFEVEGWHNLRYWGW